VVKNKLNRCRRSVVLQENQVRTLTSNLDAKKEDIQLTRVQSDRLELELRTRDENIAHLRAALNTAKTNKEYAAILTQLNTTKADNSKIETQVLDLMKDIEADEAECAGILEQIESQKKLLEKTRTESEQAAVKLQAEIEDIQKEWDEKAKDVPAEELKIFKRVADTCDGEALATVEEPNGPTATSYSCSGCFMSITPESVNLLMSKDDIIRCPNCTRILVLARDAEQSG